MMIKTIFQDNAPIHYTKIIKEWASNNNVNVKFNAT